MIDPGALALDVLETTVTLALPGLCWLFLYLLVWEDRPVAAAAGFDRRMFWLLVPGGLIASALGTIPFFGWNGNVLAINVAGGLVPVVIAFALLYRLLGASRGELPTYFALLAVETASMFALVVLFPDAPLLAVGALGIAAAFPGALALRKGLRPGPDGPRAAGPLLLTSVVLLLTFLTTAAVPGAGIESAFPYFLIPPIVGGIGAVPLAAHRLGGDPRRGVGVAYASATIGTLLGADVLRQPPLYNGGMSAILSIGGAGLVDLVYLSGLVAAGTAYLYLRGIARPPRLAGEIAPEPGGPAPRALLREADRLGRHGNPSASIARSHEAARVAATEIYRLSGGAPPEPADPWEGRGIPHWVSADYANLSALAASPSADPRDAERAWVTGTALVRFATAAGLRRWASARQRGIAFLVDLWITLVPAIALWTALFLSESTTIAVLASVPFNASVLGYAGWALLYFVLSEGLFGTTLGKSALGLAVTDRTLRTPAPLAVLLRNLPKLVPLTVAGIGAAIGVLLAVDGTPGGGAGTSTGSDPVVSAILLALVGFGFALLLGLALLSGYLGIALSSERQRLGDYLAGTWVIRRSPGRWRPA
ncbi:MAG TPA: RDD family protein [Thermoplasmata archaeon]|nr:RDD family protein [Thermoplasmata archaeon]